MQAGKAFVAEEFGEVEQLDGRVVSSWGPYTSIVGTAVKTGVAGLTAEAKLTAATSWGDMAPQSKLGVRSEVGSELVAAFNQIDTDGSGVVTRNELATAVRALNPDATDAEVDAMIALADSDGDGQVTLSEFVMCMLLSDTPQLAK